jgi:DNA-binding XRE family transcriptional regulator
VSRSDGTSSEMVIIAPRAPTVALRTPRPVNVAPTKSRTSADNCSRHGDRGDESIGDGTYSPWPLSRQALFVWLNLAWTNVTQRTRPAATILARFGSNIREVRAERGFSQEKLADLVGIDRTYIGGIERGERNPSLLNITRLASALDVHPARLFNGITTTTGSDLRAGAKET